MRATHVPSYSYRVCPTRRNVPRVQQVITR